MIIYKLVNYINLSARTHMKWFIGLIVMFTIGLLASILFLPKPPLLEDISFSQRIYDEQGHLLRLTLSADDKFRLHTHLEQISPLFIQATLLQEDQYFFYHLGFNPLAMLKAAWHTYAMQTRPFGASTITMQVARMRYGIHSKTISGKLQQIFKALQLEFYYSKEQILEAYFNLASYGGNIEGVGAASFIYLDKSANSLNLAEALRLSVIPQNPVRRRPNSLNEESLQTAYLKLFQRWLELHPEDQK